MKSACAFALVAAMILLAACGSGWLSPYQSNGQGIYFTAANEQGARIRYTGGPAFGGMGIMNSHMSKG